MEDRSTIGRFAEQLLQQDQKLLGHEYEGYRMQLEIALMKAERREMLAGRVVLITLAASIVGMYLGGSRAFGSFDPWDKDASILSIGIGVIYVICIIGFWLTFASYFSRLRPNVKAIKEQMRDVIVQDLRREITEMKKRIEEISMRGPSS